MENKIVDYIPGETQLPNSREYIEKTLADISVELTEKLHEEGVVSGMEFAKQVKERLYGEEEAQKITWFNENVRRFAIPTMPLSLSALMLGTKLNRTRAQAASFAIMQVQKDWDKYRETVKDRFGRIGQFRPIDIRKGGWGCRRRTNMGSTLVHTVGTNSYIQKPHQAQSRG